MIARSGSALLLAAPLLAASGCGSTPTGPASSGPGVRMAADDRIDGVLGHSLVVPLDDWIVAGGRLRAFVGEEETAVRVARLEQRAAPEHTDDQAAWLGPPGTWKATEFDELPMDAPSRAGWVAIVTIPVDALGKPFRISKKELHVNYLPPPSTLRVSSECWLPVLPEGVPWSFGSSPRIQGEAKNPMSRWRWRLITDGLAPDAETAPFADEAIEELARQVEDRWRVAFARLWDAKPELCVRVRKRLGAIADFGNSEWAPVWPADALDLARLQSDLLDPDATPQSLSRVAEAWLGAQPEAVAWVADDGGVVDQSRRAVVSQISLVGLTDHATMAWAVPAGVGTNPPLTPLPALRALTLSSPASHDPALPVGKVELNAGRWRTEVAALSRPIPVQPPGLTIRSLLADWTMTDWQAGTARPADWPTAALLQRPAAAPGDETVSAARRWELFVECRMQAGLGDMSREQVYVYVGPPERPVAVIRVRSSGEVENLPLRGRPDAPELLPPPTSIPITRGPDRWTFRLPIPPGGIERDGLCRLAVVRLDALGRRSTWPRAMLPWQGEPGRAALDTTAWSGRAAPAELGP